MNCIDCHEMFVADAEGLLDSKLAAEFRDHLAGCENCRRQTAEMAQLTNRLRARAETAGHAALAQQAMDRILRTTTHQLRRQAMIKRVIRLTGGGLAAAVLIVVIFMLSRTSTVASAAEVLANGVKAAANLKSIHLSARMRSLPREDIEMIGPDYDFIPIEMWKQFEPTAKWRIEKPGRIINMDGKQFVTWVQPDVGFRHGAVSNSNCFWLAQLLDVDRILDLERRRAENEKARLESRQERGADGKNHLVVTIEAKAQGDFSTSDWLKNRSISMSDNRRIYRFAVDNNRLEGLQVWIHVNGKDVLVLEITSIDYDTAIDDKLFTLKLPENMRWLGENKPSPNDAKYAKMTPREIAAAFFDALARQDWDEVDALMGVRVRDKLQHIGGLKVIQLGEPFKSGLFPGWFVPYEVQLKSGETHKFNLSIRNDNPAQRWEVDGGL
jgi:hypothetical protein